MAGGKGVVLQMPAFGAGFVTPTMVIHAVQAGATTPSAMGADMFATDLSPLQGLGPLFNGRSCGDCHNTPVEGGMGATADTFGTRVGRIDASGFDDLSGHGGPVARTHSIDGLGFFCGLPTGVSPLANVTSKRSAMTLRGTALIDFVQIPDIVTAQAAEPAEVRGKLNVLADGRPGKFGWKAQFPTLIEFMGDAFTREMGVTNPLVPDDEVNGCGANFLKPEIDALPLQTVDTFMASLDPAVPRQLPHAVDAGPGAHHQPLFGSAGPRHGAGAGRSVRGRLGRRQRLANDAALARLRARPLPARRPGQQRRRRHRGAWRSGWRRRGGLCRARCGVTASAAGVPRLHLDSGVRRRPFAIIGADGRRRRCCHRGSVYWRGAQLALQETFAALRVLRWLFVIANRGFAAHFSMLQSSGIGPMSLVLNEATIAPDHAFDCGRPFVDAWPREGGARRQDGPARAGRAGHGGAGGCARG
jgi:hypothetical protein